MISQTLEARSSPPAGKRAGWIFCLKHRSLVDSDVVTDKPQIRFNLSSSSNESHHRGPRDQRHRSNYDQAGGDNAVGYNTELIAEMGSRK